MKRESLGQILVRRGVLSPEKLDQALELQKSSGQRLASECCLNRYATELELVSSLSDQVGVPGIYLARLILPLKFLDVVPEQTAAKYAILPIRVDNDQIFLAMADPEDETLISEVSFISSRKVLACVALKSLLLRVIDHAYAAKRQGEFEYRGELAAGKEFSFDSSMAFISSEELSKVPRELIQSIPDGPDESEGKTGVETDSTIIVLDDVEDDSANETSVEMDPEDAVRVLIVDDDQEVRRLVSRLLESKGVVVEVATRGLEALNMIKHSPPDLILLDAMLPEVHGFDICRKLKSSDRYGSIPVIMISSIYRGWRFAQDLKDTYSVDAFLEKPFDLDTLWRTIDRILSGSKRQQSNAKQMSASAKKAIREGVKRYKQGNLDGAIECYREGIHIDPLSAKLHHQLAILYLKKKGMVYQAIQEFEEAVALQPDLFSALRNLAILYQSRGFKNKAIEMWERALRCSPDQETHENIRKHLMSLI